MARRARKKTAADIGLGQTVVQEPETQHVYMPAEKPGKGIPQSDTAEFHRGATRRRTPLSEV